MREFWKPRATPKIKLISRPPERNPAPAPYLLHQNGEVLAFPVAGFTPYLFPQVKRGRPKPTPWKDHKACVSRQELAPPGRSRKWEEKEDIAVVLALLRREWRGERGRWGYLSVISSLSGTIASLATCCHSKCRVAWPLSRQEAINHAKKSKYLWGRRRWSGTWWRMRLWRHGDTRCFYMTSLMAK